MSALLLAGGLDDTDATAATTALGDKADMLAEYFGLELVRVDPDGDLMLTALPSLVDGMMPPAPALPEFFAALARRVDWRSEVACFRSMAEALAALWTVPGGVALPDAPEAAGVSAVGPEGIPDDASDGVWTAAYARALRAATEHVLFGPGGLRLLWVPSAAAADGCTFTLLTCLESLFKVFERC